MDVNSLSHTKWNCKYQSVCAKVQKKDSDGQLKTGSSQYISALCKRKRVKIIESEICQNQ